jgi:hypothetical protein
MKYLMRYEGFITEGDKSVTYTRDNGKQSTGTIVEVDPKNKTVTIQGSGSGTKFKKPFSDVKMDPEQLTKMDNSKENSEKETTAPAPQVKTTQVDKSVLLTPALKGDMEDVNKNILSVMNQHVDLNLPKNLKPSDPSFLKQVAGVVGDELQVKVKANKKTGEPDFSAGVHLVLPGKDGKKPITIDLGKGYGNVLQANITQKVGNLQLSAGADSSGKVTGGFKFNF